jgi:hypothetical protein
MLGVECLRIPLRLYARHYKLYMILPAPQAASIGVRSYTTIWRGSAGRPYRTWRLSRSPIDFAATNVDCAVAAYIWSMSVRQQMAARVRSAANVATPNQPGGARCRRRISAGIHHTERCAEPG